MARTDRPIAAQLALQYVGVVDIGLDEVERQAAQAHVGVRGQDGALAAEPRVPGRDACHRRHELQSLQSRWARP